MARKSITVNELIDLLQGVVEEAGHGEMEVLLASQPNWPFEYSIREPVLIDMNPANYDEDGEYVEEHDDPKYVVYLPEGAQLNYLQAKKHHVWNY